MSTNITAPVVAADDDALAADWNKMRKDIIVNAGDYETAGGDGDTITLAIDSSISAYAAGQKFRFQANAANTGAVTLNVNAIGAIAIKKNGSLDLVDGDIKSGQEVEVVYDGTNMQLLSYITVIPNNIYGDGSEGDVTIASGTTTLTADMYYDTLTLADGAILKPNGYRIFAHKIVRNGTGKITAIGTAGGDGGGGANNGTRNTGGTAGTQANTAGTLPESKTPGAGVEGRCNGQTTYDAGDGEDADTPINDVNASGSGAGGDGENTANSKGSDGIKTTTPTNPLKTYQDIYNLLDQIDTYSRLDLDPSAGGAGGGGMGGNPEYDTGGAGGGSGSPGGIVWIACYELELNNTNVFVDVSGQDGGDGGVGGVGSYASDQDGAGGGGAGAGGNGGVVIITYENTDETLNATTIDYAGGTGGTGGAGQVISSGAGSNGGDGGDGGDGNTGKFIEVLVAV